MFSLIKKKKETKPKLQLLEAAQQNNREEPSKSLIPENCQPLKKTESKSKTSQATCAC